MELESFHFNFFEKFLTSDRFIEQFFKRILQVGRDLLIYHPESSRRKEIGYSVSLPGVELLLKGHPLV